MTTTTLQDYTGYESGAIKFSDGEIIILNWSSIYGVPQQFASGYVGMDDLETDDGDLYEYEKVNPPDDMVCEMLQHEACDQDGYKSSPEDFNAIYIPHHDITVCWSDGWN